jgi:hypothetical protein
MSAQVGGEIRRTGVTKGVSPVLVAVDTGTRRPVKILRARPTRHFLYLLVRCRCGKKFGHRADRPMIVCFHCGRMAALREVRGRRGAKKDRTAVARPAHGRAPAARASRSSLAARRSARKPSRRRVAAPAKRAR